MARETHKAITVDKVIQEEVVLNQEEITSYTVDKRNNNLIVDISLTGEGTGLVYRETHRFFGKDFISEPTEEQLWTLIDNKRRDKNGSRTKHQTKSR